MRRRWVVPGCYLEQFLCTFERFPLEVPEALLPQTHKYLRRSRGAVVGR